MGTAYLGEVDVSGPVFVLIRCKDMCHGLMIHREAYEDVHQKLYSIKVERCNRYG